MCGTQQQRSPEKTIQKIGSVKWASKRTTQTLSVEVKELRRIRAAESDHEPDLRHSHPIGVDAIRLLIYTRLYQFGGERRDPPSGCNQPMWRDALRLAIDVNVREELGVPDIGPVSGPPLDDFAGLIKSALYELEQ